MKRSRYALATHTVRGGLVRGSYRPEYDVESHQDTHSTAGSQQNCEVVPEHNQSVFTKSLGRNSRDSEEIRAVHITTATVTGLIKN